MKTHYKYLLLGLLSLSIAGCASNGDDIKGGDFPGGGDEYEFEHAVGGDYGERAGTGGKHGGDDYGAPGDGGSGEAVDTDVKENSQSMPAGQLTCSALDDNHYYDYWKELITNGQEPGQFYNYRSSIGDSFNTYNRVALKVTNANDIYITLKGEKKTFHVDNFHNAYLFPKDAKEQYDVTISYLDKKGERQTVNKTVKDKDEIDLENEFTTATNLEIMFVIDATGSMGDEMSYIKAEIDDVITKVRTDNPNSKVSLAMMVYRDIGDDYVTRYSDFTEDIASQQSFLAKQAASGGGDFEEAVDVALKEAIEKQWSTKGTKLLFHVADAPAHDNLIADWSSTVDKAVEKGIQIITVAGSGINKKTEYLFRSQSLLTGGQYVFLTDDSGIGGSHEKASVQEELVVEYLNNCLIRLIDSYHQGKDISPIPYSQIEKSDDPVEPQDD